MKNMFMNANEMHKLLLQMYSTIIHGILVHEDRRSWVPTFMLYSKNEYVTQPYETKHVLYGFLYQYIVSYIYLFSYPEVTDSFSFRLFAGGSNLAIYVYSPVHCAALTNFPFLNW